MVTWDQIQTAATTLGLAAHGDEADGLVEGRQVSLKFMRNNQDAQVLVRGRLDVPLDLGLELHRRQMVGGANKVTTGNEDLDSEFSIAADEALRAADLFTVALREHLVALNRASYDVRLHDGGCTISEPYGFVIDDSWVVHAARAAAQTIALLDGARTALRPAAPLLLHAEALRALAVSRGLAFTSTPLSVAGRIDDRPIWIGSLRSGHGHHHLAARARFATALGLDLVVRRERFLDGIRRMLGKEHITVGDEAFDRRFLVHAAPEQAGRVARLFDPTVRAALLGLDERVGLVAVDDRRVTVEPISLEVHPERVARAVETLDDVRARIEHNLLHGGEGGPYR